MLELTVFDRWGREVVARLVIRRDTVEMFVQRVSVGIAQRDLLRRWLSQPEGMLAYDDVAWIGSGDRGVALAAGDDVPCWWLEAHVLADIRAAV